MAYLTGGIPLSYGMLKNEHLFFPPVSMVCALHVLELNFLFLGENFKKYENVIIYADMCSSRIMHNMVS